jgi:endo-1,4-beta-D-glucanase Y
MDADVRLYYDRWKGTLLRRFTGGALDGERYLSAGGNGQVHGWPSGVVAATQSEAHGYAMMIVALMAGHDPEARSIFDSLDRVRKAFPSSADRRLMSWAVPRTGDPALPPQPPATDGDLDIAYALLLAARQWGDSDHLAATRMALDGIKDSLVTTGTGPTFPRLNIGDPRWASSAPPESRPFLTRPSDFMVDHLLTFAALTGEPTWSALARAALEILVRVSHPATGLVPDFVVDDPPVPSLTGTADEGLCYAGYDLNSCRVPWRQAVATAHFGVPGSRAIADRMVRWARSKFDDDPAAMTAVFSLDGEGKRGRGAAHFTSPMIAAGITDAAHQRWLDRGWDFMKSSNPARYYGGSLTLLCMLLASGNWWRPVE